MWPFSSKSTLSETNFLEGYTDWHSHILHGVDDGIATLKQALDVLDFYEKKGVKRVWLTPHIMEDYPNTTKELREKFEHLKANYKGHIELNLAAENMIDNLFEKRLEENDVLPIGKRGEHLLVETSYFNPPYGFENVISQIMSKGYYPILAHPERYRYMDTDDYKKLKHAGVLFQMNFVSLVGGFGETARKKAEWLLDNNMVELTGSDLHRLRATSGWLEMKPKKKRHLEKLLEITRNPLDI